MCLMAWQSMINSAVVERMWSGETLLLEYNRLNVKQRRMVDSVMTHVTGQKASPIIHYWWSWYRKDKGSENYISRSVVPFQSPPYQ